MAAAETIISHNATLMKPAHGSETHSKMLVLRPSSDLP